MGSLRRLVGRGLIAAAIVLGMSAHAGATTIAYPDLTLFDLNLTFDGTNFSATTPVGGSVLSWAPDSNPANGQLTLGSSAISWDGSTGAVSIVDSLGSLNLGTPGTILSGSITSFSYSLGSPGASFLLSALLTTSAPNLGLDDAVTISIGSNNFASGTGTGLGDVTPASVPEPGTLGLMALGLAAFVRRRTSQRA